jgi:hypothetical protein
LLLVSPDVAGPLEHGPNDDILQDVWM